jgi:hypothetical protein
MARFLNQFPMRWLAVAFSLLAIPAWGFPTTSIKDEFALTVWETEDNLPNNDVHSPSPMASIRDTRALARAVAMASPCEELLRLMLESESKPTAITVNRISSESVTTNAKPFFGYTYPIGLLRRFTVL